MWEELGISGGTALIVLVALYFIIKSAVKSGVRAALRERDGENCGMAEKKNCSNTEQVEH